MDTAHLLIAFVNLAVSAAALAIYARRDSGIIPADGLPDALRELINGREHPTRRLNK